MPMTGLIMVDDCTVKLPEILDIAVAKDLLPLLRDKSASGKSVWLDASAVETLGLASMQVLLSAIASCKTVSVLDPSAAFVGAFTDLAMKWEHKPAPRPQAAAVKGDPIVVKPDEPGPNQSGNKRILTIDDSKTMRDMLMLTLSSSGFDVVQAVDGEDGMKVLEKEFVDIIITDINMPKMDGYAVIEHLRRNPVYDATPILVLTTESDNEKKARARDLGATGFIVKPFDPQTLVAVIRKVSP